MYDTEQEVLEALKRYMDKMPAYHPSFFRVAELKEPRFDQEYIRLVPFNQKASYSMDDVLARLWTAASI